MRKIFFIIFLLLLGTIGYVVYRRNVNPHMLGGPCTYKSYDGTCRITSIKKTPKTLASENGQPYDGYEVLYVFSLKDQRDFEKIWLNYGKDIAGGKVNELMHPSYYLGDLFINKYGLKEGGQYPCVLQIIDKGTCAPFGVDFTELDMADYVDLQNTKNK